MIALQRRKFGVLCEESFTVTYFTTPPQALEEVKQVGFNVVSYAGAESFLSARSDFNDEFHKTTSIIIKSTKI